MISKQHFRSPYFIVLTGLIGLAAAFGCLGDHVRGPGDFLDPLPRARASEGAGASATGVVPLEGARPFAVVELFTSEGCSSCPPADALLSRLAGELDGRSAAGDEDGDEDGDGDGDGGEVLLLSFHVDYWNRLGWPDPFSSAAWSDRQRSYASARRTSRVYTPQMVVNGGREFVGHHESKARDAIADALKQVPSVALSLSARLAEDGAAVELLYGIEGSADGTLDSKLLHLLLVEDGLSTAVPRGENAGRTLRHDRVVRSMTTRDLGQTGSKRAGEASLPLPAGFDPERGSVVALVQQPGSMHVLGAARTEW